MKFYVIYEYCLIKLGFMRKCKMNFNRSFEFVHSIENFHEIQSKTNHNIF